MSATLAPPVRTAPSRVQAPVSTAYARRWYTLGVLCLSLLVIVVDTTIVNVALPTLARQLQATTSGLQWIVDAYTLTFAALLLLAGAIADRYGRHHALAAGLAIFAAGSLAAAFTQTTAELIAARAVMGIGGAFIMPATLSIITGVFTDPAERTKAIGLWSAVSGLGVVGEHRRDDRQRGRHDERAADAHHRAGRDELAGGLGERRGQRPGGEDGQPAGQREVPAVPVRDGPGQQQQRGEGEGVGVHDPLQPAGARVQVPREGRQRHVDDGGVHHDDEQAEAEHPQRVPPAGEGRITHDYLHLYIRKATTVLLN